MEIEVLRIGHEIFSYHAVMSERRAAQVLKGKVR